MKDGFIKTMAASPSVEIADTDANTEEIKTFILKAQKEKANLLLLPELCITGYSCGDMFFSQRLIDKALKALSELKRFSVGSELLIIAGVPIRFLGKLYNCAAALQNGKILGIAAKSFLPNYNEFYEKRQFSSARDLKNSTNLNINIDGEAVPFGRNIVFRDSLMEDFSFGIEICEDLWAPEPPSDFMALSGANIILCPSASNELTGKAEYRKSLISTTSSRLLCGYVYCSAGYTESTSDTVMSAHRIICENGLVLSDSGIFPKEDYTVSEIDVLKLSHERHQNTSFETDTQLCRTVYFEQEISETKLTRKFDRLPFVPNKKDNLAQRAETILNIQGYGLAKRLLHTKAKTAVIGISGGLDSTLALLAAVRAFKICGLPLSGIIAVTMPGFGTTQRTKSNAESLCTLLKVTLKKINIEKAVLQHFSDIGHNKSVLNHVYENAQARERTQILMDIANRESGLVIGTGDLSELALGWATYNGDHMSMYGVNASVPKTLVRYLIKYEAENYKGEISDILSDILVTPVSPELLPRGKDGEISQKTEDIVGPYELHDFFLYYFMRYGFSPSKIKRIADIAFEGKYEKVEIQKWLKVFIKRFFAMQFKRSCLPDGPKVGAVSLSPRGDFRMPSDVSGKIFLDDIE